MITLKEYCTCLRILFPSLVGEEIFFAMNSDRQWCIFRTRPNIEQLITFRGFYYIWNESDILIQSIEARVEELVCYKWVKSIIVVDRDNKIIEQNGVKV